MSLHIRAIITSNPGSEPLTYTLEAVTDYGARREALKNWPKAHAIRLEMYSLRASEWRPWVTLR